MNSALKKPKQKPRYANLEKSCKESEEYPGLYDDGLKYSGQKKRKI